MINLSDISLAGNKIASFPHYRLYSIHSLAQLGVLDGRTVEYRERKTANDRFSHKRHRSAVLKMSKDISYDKSISTQILESSPRVDQSSMILRRPQQIDVSDIELSAVERHDRTSNDVSSIMSLT